MNKTFKLFGMIAAVAIVGFSVTGCDNGNGGAASVIPSPWAGTFIGGGYTWTLHANGTVTWNIGGESGQMSGGTVVPGGTVSMGGQTGQWVYIMQGGQRWGIIVHPTPYGASVALARGAVQSLLSDAQGMGATFSPSPNLGNIIAALPGGGYQWWGGDTNP